MIWQNIYINYIPLTLLHLYIYIFISTCNKGLPRVVPLHLKGEVSACEQGIFSPPEWIIIRTRVNPYLISGLIPAPLRPRGLLIEIPRPDKGDARRAEGLIHSFSSFRPTGEIH